DGAEDLLITSGRGGTVAYYRNVHGRLVRVDPHLPPARYDETTVLPLPDGKGGSTLLVGQSNYDSQTPSEAVAVPSVIAIAPSGGGGGGRVTPAVAGDVGSVGPLAVADVDGAGSLDLFVGGRVAPGVYPPAVPSRRFRNEAGGLCLDTPSGGLSAGVGLIRV